MKAGMDMAAIINRIALLVDEHYGELPQPSSFPEADLPLLIP